MPSVPTLDLRELETPTGALALCEGLAEYGFVRVVGHGIEAAPVAEMYRAAACFFALPEEAKRRCGGAAGGQRGFTPFGVEHAKGSNEGDLKEFFHIGRAGAASPELENRWPEEVPELRMLGSQLFEALEALSIRLLGAIECGLRLEPGSVAGMIEGGSSLLRVLHYPPVSAADRPRALRAAPHEDINLITLLCEATGSGLEILRPSGEWLPVECGSGTIVVDSGDMLTRATGGVLPATTHRVVRDAAAERESRYSLPFFAHPRPECDLSVRPPLATPSRLAAHPPILAGEYLAQRLREIGLQ